jgi:hypothetical protein
MIGIFMRELRENFKWAAVICLVLFAIVVHEVHNSTPLLLFELSGQSLIFIAPIAGLLLGVAQTFFETKSDNWAFTVHRPLHREGIFIAKCVAGLVLLYTALAIPCIFAAAWAARPGNQTGPFQGRMVLPLIADIFNAGCYYFAAMVVVLRKARWYGTRILPVGIALASSMLIVRLTPHFWQAALIIAIVQCIGALAAWGAFANNGASEGGLLPRVALGAMMYPGALELGAVLVGLSQGFWSGGGPWHSYQIGRDGNAVRTTLSIRNGERRWSVTDPSGNPIAGYDGLDLDDPANSNLFVRFNARLFDDQALAWPIPTLSGMSYRSPLPGVLPLGSVAPPGIRPRFSSVYNLQRQLIELYDPISHALIGTVGPAGFARADAPSTSDQRFPGTALNLASQRLRRALPFDSTVYWIELDQRRVKLVFIAPADDPITSAGDVGTPADPSIVIVARHHLHLIRPSGEKIFSTPLELDPISDFTEAALLPNGHLILQIGSFPGRYHDIRVVEFLPDGATRQTRLPRLPELRGPKPYETASFGALFPLAARPLVPSWVLDEVLDVRAQDFATLFEAAVTVSAIVSALLTTLLGWRYGLGPKRILAWSLTNLLIGPAGLVVLLGLYERPTRELCTACGASRFADRRYCPHCNASLPPPLTDGSEIFEPQEDALEAVA